MRIMQIFGLGSNVQAESASWSGWGNWGQGNWGQGNWGGWSGWGHNNWGSWGGWGNC